jgi:signal transduction histidine kinase
MFRSAGPQSLSEALRGWRRHFLELLRLSAPGTPQLLSRIQLMERDIVLPIKVAGIGMLLYSFYFSAWVLEATTALDVAVETTQYFLGVYLGISVAVGLVLLNLHRLPLALVQWVVFTSCLVDGIFLASLTLVTGGYDSFLYWLFLALIVRGAVSVPRATSQLALNLTLSICYVLAGFVDLLLADMLDDTSRVQLGLAGPFDDLAEPLLLRVVLLLLMILCCYGVQVLLERHRVAVEEAREFALREGQLRSAGRLAAEFAHQIKNPLAIINTACYSVQRALRDGKSPSPQHISIIQEEIDRADRIITQIMGYAQLSEGRVEKLSVTEELDAAIERVFPRAIEQPVRVTRDYGPELPPLLMLRRHLSETFVNLLLNAREALGPRGGNVRVEARSRGDHAVEVVVADDGPGIPPERQERVFEAYFTTKEKGTGLGLASVKHNTELYGGKVRLESALGKGARFIVTYPARTMVQIANTT